MSDISPKDVSTRILVRGDIFLLPYLGSHKSLISYTPTKQ